MICLTESNEIDKYVVMLHKLVCQIGKISTECAINAFTSNRTKYDHVNRQLINHKRCRQQMNSHKVIAEISMQDKKVYLPITEKKLYQK